MSDNAFGGSTDDRKDPNVTVPDDASELFDGSLDGEPAPAEPKPGSDSGFGGDVGDALPGGEQPATAPEESDEDEDPVRASAAVDERVAALTGDLQRLNAEYVNYKRRVERDREVTRATAIGSVVESLIPVLDDIFAAREHGDLGDGPFAKIADKLEGILGKHGVTQVGAEGETFDPNHHEAMIRMEAELPEGTTETTVVKVLQPGFKVGERVVRAARVAVADPDGN